MQDHFNSQTRSEQNETRANFKDNSLMKSTAKTLSHYKC